MKFSFQIDLKQPAFALAPDSDGTSIVVDPQHELFLYGDIFYYIKESGPIQMLDIGQKAALRKIFSQEKLEHIISHLEGQYLGVLLDRGHKRIKVFADRYTRLDLFYAEHNGHFYASTILDDIFKHVRPEHDPLMMAHLFSVYGWYTPKGKTIYKNVQRLKVGEQLTLTTKGIDSKIMAFKPLKTQAMGESDLEEYYQFLRQSVVARSNHKGITWVSGSSGWDSSTILGVLAQEVEAKQIAIVTGSVEYSRATKVINQFEINKILKIAEFYGIKPHIAHMDFKSKASIPFWLKRLAFFKSKHIYSTTTFNFSKLAEGCTQAMGPGQIVLNGETSDSFHNLGFSQFATFFHTKKSFTEYADKMNCYLYGPSFFEKVLHGSFQKDKVFQIFMKMTGEGAFDLEHKDIKSRLMAYFYPFFYGSPRIPFARNFDNPALTQNGQQAIFNFPFGEYMPQVLDSVTGDTLYSWLIYMYLNFHSQGSTVAVQRYAMELDSHNARSPYNDTRLIALLSQAPESWGRGLELNHTKYPLKWVGRNKIRFPYALLQEGPHSYLYDVIEGFSLLEEIMYRSAVSKLFKEVLAERAYRQVLDNDYFDVNYIDRLVTAYLAGRETKGKDFTNLFSLATVSATGWY